MQGDFGFLPDPILPFSVKIGHLSDWGYKISPHWTVEGKIFFFQSEFNSVDLLKTVIYGLGSMHLNLPLNAQ